MFSKKLIIFIFSVLLLSVGCQEVKKQQTDEKENLELDFKEEKKAILETLNNETKAAFQRNYEDWQTKWIHDPSVTKIYINFPENTFSESVGWGEISQFVKTFFKEHPEPEPIPKPIANIDVRLYGNGAWVVYEQQDSVRGLKRETRLMEKENDEWKIAGMQTTIYGFKNQPKEILFVCTHGAARSPIAAAYFNKIAQEKGLNYHAVFRGTEPDSILTTGTSIGLTKDEFEVSDWKPEMVSENDVSSAYRIITFDCEISSTTSSGIIEQWNGTPPISKDYDKAVRSFIKTLTK